MTKPASMCMVIRVGFKLLSTTVFPNHASNRNKNSTPKERSVIVLFSLQKGIEKITINNNGSPAKTVTNLLMYSVQV